MGVLEFIHEQLKIRRHLVIVVAEGAGSGVRDLKNLKEGAEVDQSGNIKLPVPALPFRISAFSSRHKS
jgi:hypothetical protein